YQIPMRPGTYIVTVDWAEPRTDGSEHVFHLEIERQRVILHGENMVKAPRTLVSRSFRVTTADGALNLDFLVNPVVSYIDTRRAGPRRPRTFGGMPTVLLQRGATAPDRKLITDAFPEIELINVDGPPPAGVHADVFFGGYMDWDTLIAWIEAT